MLVPVPQPGEYTVELCTDDDKYGGFHQVEHIPYPTKRFDGKDYVELYLPARTAVVLKEHVVLPKEEKKFLGAYCRKQIEDMLIAHEA